MKLRKRNKYKSFAWSIVRDPTARAISHFFHFVVSRDGTAPTDENFITFLNETTWLCNFQLEFLAMGKIEQEEEVIQRIMNEYDFLGATERMDESAVALQMILGLETSDVMYISSAKSNGGYDGGGYKRTCFRIPKPFVSSRVQDYLQSKHWKEIVYWDEVLHQAINKSLDLTIEQLGPDEFKRNLEIYRHMKNEVAEYCHGRVTYPCSSTGVRTEQRATDCFHTDSGCGFECMDEYFRNRNESNGMLA